MVADSFRVERVRVELEVYVNFEGRRKIAFDYAPASNDEPLVAAALAKNTELLDAELREMAARGVQADLGFL